MKLAEPITTPAGITLMPAGIRLTPMFLVRIKKWNVEELDVFVERSATSSSRRKKKLSETQTQTKPAAQDSTRRTSSDTKTGAGKKTAPRPSDTRTLTAAEEEFARSTAAEISRAFVNVKQNPTMMLLRVAVIKRLIMHGRDGVVNILRREFRPSGEESA